MVEVSEEAFQEVADELRDVINWVAVFNEEYALPEEIARQLGSRLRAIAEKLGLETID